ncbi:15802_t:CDS:2 [Gigaspora margarita]|uniref:15802_t:CDS:1 n=1 Tax=Gigaspora margarita TaxID=4874 RepID=A0ABN7V3V1_GIGMA|nr:15802_t:CDS:2 [Gigaspora margarita]
MFLGNVLIEIKTQSEWETKHLFGKVDELFVTIGEKTITSYAIISEAENYTVIVGNDWLKKMRARLDWEECELIIRDNGKKEIEESISDKETESESEEKEEYKDKSLINNTYFYIKFQETNDKSMICKICLKVNHDDNLCVFKKTEK